MKVNGLTYHLERYGEGRPLVMLHGFTGSTQNWHPHLATLQGSFDSLLLDLPGHGRTEAPPDPARYAMPRVAADVAAIIQEQFDKPVMLLGYSMGGRLALYIAIYYPHLVSHLILESSSPGLSDAKARATRCAQDNALADRIEAEGIPWFVNYWENIPLFKTQEGLPLTQRATLRQQRLNNSAQGLANSLRGMGTGVQPSLWRWSALGSLSMPTMLLAGALDTKFVLIANAMQAAIPHSHVMIVPEVGHAVHLEAPSAFEAAIVVT